MRRHPILLVLILVCSCSPAWALAVGPGLFSVQNVRPGTTLDVAAAGGPCFTMPNASATAIQVAIAVQGARASGLGSWEAGYDDPRQVTWAAMDRNRLTIAPAASGTAALSLALPDQPEFWNRRFLLAVAVSEDSLPKSGVGLTLVARVMIETAPSDDPASLAGGTIATLPSQVDLVGRPGQQVQALLTFRNNSGREFVPHWARLPEVYADRVRHPRFASSDCLPLVDESWLVPPPPVPAWPTGAEFKARIFANIPTAAAPGRYEELLFLRERPSDGQGSTPEEAIAFVRVRIQVEEPGSNGE